jgi:hypothetical protein
MPNLSRRHLVTTAAALPALALPAAAGTLALEPDPIFAAIERYRAFDEAYYALCDYEENLTESGHKLTLAPGDHRTPEMAAAVAAVRSARADLTKTAPSTPAGMVAYLDYVVSKSVDELMFEGWNGDGDDETMDFIRSLARGARLIAREAVQS